MADTFYPLNTPLRNYLFYAAPLTQNGPNVPLSGGFIFFRSADDHDEELDTYEDREGTIINPNPLPLGSAGDAPPIYMQDELYFIIVTDSSGDINNPVFTVDNYDPSQNVEAQDVINNNYIANGQFTYPITFWRTDQEEGEIETAVTRVAWAWDFVQDKDTTPTSSKNFVTFQDISGEPIPGSPINQIVLTCEAVGVGEANKQFRTVIGSVNFRAGESITISEYLVSLIDSNPTVSIFIEKNYGTGGSPPETIPVKTFSINNTRTQYAANITLPDNSGKTIGEGNYLAINIQIALGQTCQVGMTNVISIAGVSANPVYPEESQGDTVAQILGDSAVIDSAGLNENFSLYTYNNGIIFPIPRTGECSIYTLEKNPPDTLLCVASPDNSLTVSGYQSGTNIPNRRLYDVIGNTYGGSGDLIVTASNNVVTFSSDVGGRPLTAFSAETAPVTITNTVIGCKLGFTAVQTSSNTVDVEWIADFAPNQTNTAFIYTPIYNNINGLMTYNAITVANNNISIATVNPGSGVTQAQATLSFNTSDIINYQTNIGGGTVKGVQSFLDFADITNNTRGSFVFTQSGWQANVIDGIAFSVDGAPVPTPLFNPIVARVVVPFSSVKTLSQNVAAFCLAAANPFQTTVTVNSEPANNSHFFYSSITTDYYGWFNTGGGVDPGPFGGRTGVEIPYTPGSGTTAVATAIALATNNLVYSIPQPSDLPDLTEPTKNGWYIHT